MSFTYFSPSFGSSARPSTPRAHTPRRTGTGFTPFPFSAGASTAGRQTPTPSASLHHSVNHTSQYSVRSNLPHTTSTASINANRWPERPTNESKLRLVFEELDIDNKRRVDPNGFRRVLKALHIDFTPATIEDLFQRGDVAKKGSMVYSDFLNWAELYPSLIDALYFRSRESVERVRREQLIENTKAPLDELSRKERGARQVYETVLAELEDSQKALQFANEEIGRREQEDSEAFQAIVLAAKDLEKAKSEKSALESDLIVAREMQKKVLRPLNEVRADISGVTLEMEGAHNRVESLNQRKQELQEELDAIAREIQRGQGVCDSFAEDIESLREVEKKHEQKYTKAEADSSDIETEIASQDEEIQRLNYKKCELENEKARATAQIREAMATVTARQYGLAEVQEKEAQTKKAYDAVVRSVEAATEILRGVENEFATYLQQRNEAEISETTLLEGEVRLREQRYNLDDRDHNHLDQHTRYSTVSRVNESRFSHTMR